MEISLARVVEAARERRSTLTPEVAGYVILLAAQQVLVEAARISADSVLLDEAGDVLVLSGAATSEREIEAALRGLLGALIQLCASPPPAIGAVASRAPGGDLRGLIAELSAALIPINHAAAHRALARLYRETRRAGGAATEVALPPIRDPRPRSEPGELEIDVVIDRGDAADPSARSRSGEPPSQVEPENTHPELAISAEVQREPEAGPERELQAEAEPRALPPVAPIAELERARSDAAAGSGADVGEAAAAQGDGTLDGAAADHSRDEARGGARSVTATGASEVRSDVDELLEMFLAETRSVERMLPALRQMIGLEPPPRSSASEPVPASEPR